MMTASITPLCDFENSQTLLMTDLGVAGDDLMYHILFQIIIVYL